MGGQVIVGQTYLFRGLNDFQRTRLQGNLKRSLQMLHVLIPESRPRTSIKTKLPSRTSQGCDIGSSGLNFQANGWRISRAYWENRNRSEFLYNKSTVLSCQW